MTATIKNSVNPKKIIDTARAEIKAFYASSDDNEGFDAPSNLCTLTKRSPLAANIVEATLNTVRLSVQELGIIRPSDFFRENRATVALALLDVLEKTTASLEHSPAR